jgi:hypothetical protein
MIKINKLMLCLAILVSTHAQAKVQTFEEVFTGTIAKTGVIDPDNFDPDNLIGQSTLSNGDVTLTLFYPMFDFSPSHYPGAGTFTRTDSLGALSGDFSAYYSLPDIGSPSVPFLIGGLFNQDNRSLTLPNTGAYQYSWSFGRAEGKITDQGYVTLKINWQIGIPDVLVPVPEPQTGFMFGSGLLILGFLHRLGRFRRRFKYCAAK